MKLPRMVLVQFGSLNAPELIAPGDVCDESAEGDLSAF